MLTEPLRRNYVPMGGLLAGENVSLTRALTAAKKLPGGAVVTEADFQSAVIAAAKLFCWRVVHHRPARTRSGWRTAVEGNGAEGFPDLVLLHRRHGLLFRELKANGSSKVTREQADWLADLEAGGVDASVWRPDQWDEIEATLRGAA